MVKKHTLLLIAGIVWSIAGFNILRIGILSYKPYLGILNFILSAAVFVAFWLMVFKKLVLKHTDRIVNYEEELQWAIKFFDLKSFIIMAFMITMGLTIRGLNLAPEKFIAIFYTGLGAALFLAGILFTVNYISYRRRLSYESNI